METVITFIKQQPVAAATAVGAAGLAAGLALYGTSKIVNAYFLKSFLNTLGKLEKKPDHYENGVIYLHILPRSYCRKHLNMSPFVVKLESWLRLHKIPYKVVETFRPSATTRQTPYITLDGEEIADSNKVIHFLEKKFNIAENEGLVEEQQAISHCLLRTFDESFAWTYCALRYIHYDEFYTNYMHLPASGSVKDWSVRLIRNGVTQRLITHGIGRKTIQDITEIAKDDIHAISRHLGKKKFLMGDQISKVDCSAFGHLSQVIHVDLNYPHKEIISKECANILPYMTRVKNQLWPDWDQLVIQ